MESVVGHCWAKIPASDTMWGPGGTLSWGLIREDAASWWSKRGFVEVECTVDLGVGRKIGVDVGFTKEVKGEYGVWDKAAP